MVAKGRLLRHAYQSRGRRARVFGGKHEQTWSSSNFAASRAGGEPLSPEGIQQLVEGGTFTAIRARWKDLNVAEEDPELVGTAGCSGSFMIHWEKKSRDESTV